MRFLFLTSSSCFGFFSAFYFTVAAHAASCCGSGLVAPSLVTGDQSAQLSVQYAYLHPQSHYVDQDGFWKRWDSSFQENQFVFQGTHVFGDRWQAGFELPLIHSLSDDGASDFEIGNMGITLGYEAVPNWDYHPIRPQVFVYSRIRSPSRDWFDSVSSETELTSANRFWTVGLGSLILKSWSPIDVYANVLVSRSLSKRVQTSESEIVLHPGWGASLGLGGGYTFEDFRFGISLTTSVQDPIDTTGDFESVGSVQRLVTGELSVAYAWNENWQGALSYSDQTLFGSPRNSSLERTYALRVQRAWLR